MKLLFPIGFALIAFLKGISGENVIACVENDNEDGPTFIPSPTDCSKYYVCDHSTLHEMSCPDSLWFNTELNICDYPQNVKCGATTKMVEDPANHGNKCGNPRDEDRVFDLRGEQATEENCKSKCLKDPACIAFSGIWNNWCIGCERELDQAHTGSVAFKKVDIDCQEPWVRPGSSVACYLTSSGDGLKFNRAARYCKKMNGRLAEPRSDFETASIQQLLDPNTNYWIGMTDREEEGTFLWQSGQSGPTYSNWQEGQPDNGPGNSRKNQNCAQLWAKNGHKWDDQTCSTTEFTNNGNTYQMQALCQNNI